MIMKRNNGHCSVRLHSTVMPVESIHTRLITFCGQISSSWYSVPAPLISQAELLVTAGALQRKTPTAQRKLKQT